VRHTAGIFLLASVLAGCSATVAPAGSIGSTLAPDASSPGAPSAAAVTPAPSPSGVAIGDGRIIHVNLFVPLTGSPPVGSSCGATDLKSTGPVAETIPGASFKFFQVLAGLPGVPAETPQSAPTPPGAEGPRWLRPWTPDQQTRFSPRGER